MPANGTASDVAISSSSDSGSPPVEIISMVVEDDADFDDNDSITMLDDSGRLLEYDPSASFPFHDSAESYMETVIRLLPFLPTRKSSPLPLQPISLTNSRVILTRNTLDEQVPRAFIEWIDKYLIFVKTAPLPAVEDSTFMHRDMWQAVPQLVLHMVSRK